MPPRLFFTTNPAAGKERRRRRKQKLKRARNWVNLLTFALSAVCVCYSHSSSASHNDARDYEQRGKERPSIRDAFVIYARRLRSTVKARRERRLTLCITMMNESCRIDSRSNSSSSRQRQRFFLFASFSILSVFFLWVGGEWGWGEEKAEEKETCFANAKEMMTD